MNGGVAFSHVPWCTTVNDCWAVGGLALQRHIAGLRICARVCRFTRDREVKLR